MALPTCGELFAYATGQNDWSSAAYQHLSPSLRAYLETLEAVHSGTRQAEEIVKSGVNPAFYIKRELPETVHPLVRRHPVTGKKALFVNRQFTNRIVGLKKEESEALLNLLFNHIERGHDFQLRIRWKPRTVLLWDSESPRS